MDETRGANQKLILAAMILAVSMTFIDQTIVPIAIPQLQVTGPVLGFALIFADISLIPINVIGALVLALLVPYIAIGRTLQRSNP